MPFHPALGDYGKAKATMQLECLRFAEQNPNPRVSIVSPGAVYGPRGGLFCRTPYEMAATGSFAWFDEGKGICNYVYVDNLVDAALRAAREPAAHGECFIVVDGQTTWREFLTPLVEPWLDRIPNFSSQDIKALRRKTIQRGTLRDILVAILNSPEVMAAVSRHRLLGASKEWLARRFPKRHRRIQSLRAIPNEITKPWPAQSRPPLWLAEIFGPGTVRFPQLKRKRCSAGNRWLACPKDKAHVFGGFARFS